MSPPIVLTIFPPILLIVSPPILLTILPPVLLTIFLSILDLTWHILFSSIAGVGVSLCRQVSNIAKDLGLEVGAWQDGVMHKFEEPFARSSFPNDVVTVYAWKNVWETGMAFDIYKLANSGYKVHCSVRHTAQIYLLILPFLGWPGIEPSDVLFCANHDIHL